MAHVVSIVYTPRDVAVRKPADRFARVVAERVHLVESHGIEGDAKGGAGDRHLNVMFSETLAQLQDDGFQVAAGALGEQLVIAGLDPAKLSKGTRVQIGTAIIEMGEPRTGCARFEMIHGKPRQAAKGRLGVMATVVAAGEVAVGDAVEVVPA